MNRVSRLLNESSRVENAESNILEVSQNSIEQYHHTMSKHGFIILQTYYGLGNRMLSILSAFVLAMVEKRNFKIIWNGEAKFDELFIDHFSGLELKGGLLELIELTKSNGYDMNHISSVDLRGLSKDIVPLSSSLLGCSEPDENKWLHSLSHPVLLIHSDQFFLPLLFASPLYKRQLNELFKFGKKHDEHGCLSCIVTTLAQYLFQPAAKIERYVNDIILKRFDTHFDKGRRKLLSCTGLHIRTPMFDFETNLVPLIDIKQAFLCAEKAKMVDNETCIDKKQTVFLATASSLVRDKGFKYFGDQFWQAVMPHERDSIERNKKRTNRLSKDGEVGAVVDLFLLASCQNLVTSVHSSFSYMASALSGVAPIVVTEMQKNKSRCKWQPSSLPCFHVWNSKIVPELLKENCTAWREGNLKVINENDREVTVNKCWI
eukprot:g3705.t1